MPSVYWRFDIFCSRNHSWGLSGFWVWRSDRYWESLVCINLLHLRLMCINQNYLARFWFFASRKNPETAPLVLWFNGGVNIYHSRIPSAWWPSINSPEARAWSACSKSMVHAELITTPQQCHWTLSRGTTKQMFCILINRSVWVSLMVTRKLGRLRRLRLMSGPLSKYSFRTRDSLICNRTSWLSGRSRKSWLRWSSSYWFTIVTIQIRGPLWPDLCCVCLVRFSRLFKISAFSSYFLKQNAAILERKVSGKLLNLQVLGIGDGLTVSFILHYISPSCS